MDLRLTILWFTDGDSLVAWDEFAGTGELAAATGLGRVALMAPFTPSFPAPSGTSTSCRLDEPARRSCAVVPELSSTGSRVGRVVLRLGRTVSTRRTP